MHVLKPVLTIPANFVFEYLIPFCVLSFGPSQDYFGHCHTLDGMLTSIDVVLAAMNAYPHVSTIQENAFRALQQITEASKMLFRLITSTEPKFLSSSLPPRRVNGNIDAILTLMQAHPDIAALQGFGCIYVLAMIRDVPPKQVGSRIAVCESDYLQISFDQLKVV
jgi:hypothetical protein